MVKIIQKLQDLWVQTTRAYSLSYPSIDICVSQVFAAPSWKLWKRILNVEDFPRYMPNVREAKVLARRGRVFVTQWQVEVDEVPIAWKEEARLDLKAGRIQFRALEGDFEVFEGCWELSPVKGGTLVQIRVRAVLGVPMLEQAVHPLLERVLRKNFREMLAAFKRDLTGARYRKLHTGKPHDLASFAIIGHPYNLQHLIQYFRSMKPTLKPPSNDFLLEVFSRAPAYLTNDVLNVVSETGKRVNGHFIMCPMVPDTLTRCPDRVVEKIIEACHVAEGLGAGICLLGGFTSIAGERYSALLKERVSVPLTSGNSLTVAYVVDGVMLACQWMDIDLSRARLAVIGGTGDIGSGCARVLAHRVREIVITGRSQDSLKRMVHELPRRRGLRVSVTLDNEKAVRDADVVIAAANSPTSIVDTRTFKPGAVVCDVGYPKNISHSPSRRNDILVFSGGLTMLPCGREIEFDIGLPTRRLVYACWAEAIVLALEKRFEPFSAGKGFITPEKVDEIRALATKHGFRLAPFYWGNDLLDERRVREIGTYARAA